MPSACMALAFAATLKVGESPIRFAFSEIMMDLGRRARGYFSGLDSGLSLSLRNFFRSAPVRALTTSGSWAMTSATWPVIRVVRGTCPADDDDLVDLAERLGHGLGHVGQDLHVHVEHRRVAVLVPGGGLLRHGLSFRSALLLDLLRLGLAFEPDGSALPRASACIRNSSASASDLIWYLRASEGFRTLASSSFSGA